MKIALDVVGGDFAPDSTIEGVKLALNELPSEVTVVLIGPEALIRSKLKQFNIASRSGGNYCCRGDN